MSPTKIEWTRGDDGTPGETWNPTLGCSKVSPGCDNCYAIRVAARGMSPEHHGLTERRMTEDGDLLPPDWTGEVRCLPERLDVPLRWRKPRRVFVDSMSDLFHPQVPDGFIVDVWARMAVCARHAFQVLTKRPRRMAEFLAQPDLRRRVAEEATELMVRQGSYDRWRVEVDWPAWEAKETPAGNVWEPQQWPLPNVWLGTSVEDQHLADRRIPHLLAAPAAVRFLSCEPLLGLIDLVPDAVGGYPESEQWARSRGPSIDWVICGGESGPGARPMHPEWARGLRDQCVAAGVSFFFKQWGEHAPLLGSIPAGYEVTFMPGLEPVQMVRCGKKRAGRVLDGRTWDQYPETTAVTS